MTTWIIPALKAVLPHIDTIIATARPMFTKPRPQDDVVESDSPSDILQQQLMELQSATAQNDASIKELAAQLQHTVSAIQQAAAEAEARSRTQARMVLVAVVTAGVSIILSLAILFGRG